MEYRINFIVESLGMILNNFAFSFIWIIYFKKFDSIQGWGVNEVFLLHGVTGMYFGLATIFAGGYKRLSRKIEEGDLDFYLSFPKDTLWHILVSYMEPSAIGELLFGIIIFTFSGYLSFTSIIMFLLTSTLAAIIYLSTGVVYQSLALYLGKSEELSMNLMWTLVGFTLYPTTIFKGGIKFFLYTIFPAILIAGLPSEIVQSPNYKDLLILFGSAIAFVIIGRTIFQFGLRRYTSGNLMTTRV